MFRGTTRGNGNLSLSSPYIETYIIYIPLHMHPHTFERFSWWKRPRNATCPRTCISYKAAASSPLNYRNESSMSLRASDIEESHYKKSSRLWLAKGMHIEGKFSSDHVHEAPKTLSMRAHKNVQHFTHHTHATLHRHPSSELGADVFGDLLADIQNKKIRFN